MLSDVKTRAAMITISCSNIVNNDPSNLCALFFYLFISLMHNYISHCYSNFLVSLVKHNWNEETDQPNFNLK